MAFPSGELAHRRSVNTETHSLKNNLGWTVPLIRLRFSPKNLVHFNAHNTTSLPNQYRKMCSLIQVTGVVFTYLLLLIIDTFVSSHGPLERGLRLRPILINDCIWTVRSKCPLQRGVLCQECIIRGSTAIQCIS